MELVFWLILMLGWSVFQIVRRSKRAQSGTDGKNDGQAVPRKPAHPYALGGGWAEIFGLPDNGDDRTPPDAPLETQTAFGNPTDAARPSSTIPSDFMSGEGDDLCHEYMLAPERVERPNVNDAYSLPLDRFTPGDANPVAGTGMPFRFDVPAILQGVVFTEILMRPAQRRRPGTWPSR
jgi:hypothetical protein